MSKQYSALLSNRSVSVDSFRKAGCAEDKNNAPSVCRVNLSFIFFEYHPYAGEFGGVSRRFAA